jgi:predicted GNAT family acetyltransferase
VLDYAVRFTRPVVVPYGQPATLDVAGKIRSIDAEAGTAVVDLIASVNGETVLAKARVTVRQGQGHRSGPRSTMTDAGTADAELGAPGIELTKNAGAGRYELHLDGQLVSQVDYTEQGGVVVLPHTETDPAFGRRGLAAQLVRFALDDIAAAGLKVDPACPYVAAYIRKNQGYARLVA